MNNSHTFVRRRVRPRPLDHERARDEVEDQLLDEWQIGNVEDLVDDSVQYIQEELESLGISQQKLSEITERIKNNILSVWARQSLYGCCECLEPNGTNKFLARKFGT
jgi:hypothetical protein